MNSVIAWVLVSGLWFNNGFTISGIASKEACEDLIRRIRTIGPNLAEMKCLPYEAITGAPR